MKAILVIDLPEHCSDCSCEQNGICLIKSVVVESIDRPSCCPLKPMPQKLDANDWHRMFGGTYKEREAKGYGWNECIDEIIGGEK